MDTLLHSLWCARPNSDPFTLSHEGDELNVVIPKRVLQHCAKQDMFVLDFLYQSYRKKLNGVILNVEEDMNPHLQVSAFVIALREALELDNCILVICRDKTLIKWHYYLNLCGEIEVHVVTKESIPLIRTEETVFLLGFSNIKLVETSMLINHFCVIIDQFDEVATKMVIRKLKSRWFNIGITYRNFYTNPDQKLQWSMLNWANHGCVGKLADFYETDNENYLHFRDSYKEWWFRITWNFCESFVRPSLAKTENLSKILSEWAEEYNLSEYCMRKMKKPVKRRAKLEIKNEDSSSEESTRPKRTRRVYKESTQKTNASKINYNGARHITETPKSDSEDSPNSSGTIIYEAPSRTQSGDEGVQETEKDVPHISLTNAGEPERLQENTCSNESMSSSEQLIFSLVSDEKSNLQGKIKISAKSDDHPSNTAENIDESDMFLKNFAAKDNIFIGRSAEQSISNLINAENEEGSCKGISDIDFELSERIILGTTDVPTESDYFLKEICTEKNKEENNVSSIVNNNSAATSSSLSDVDALVAEVMEMVKKQGQSK